MVLKEGKVNLKFYNDKILTLKRNKVIETIATSCRLVFTLSYNFPSVVFKQHN